MCCLELRQIWYLWDADAAKVVALLGREHEAVYFFYKPYAMTKVSFLNVDDRLQFPDQF